MLYVLVRLHLEWPFIALSLPAARSFVTWTLCSATYGTFALIYGWAFAPQLSKIEQSMLAG